MKPVLCWVWNNLFEMIALGLSTLAVYISWRTRRENIRKFKKANLVASLDREPQRNYIRFTLVINNEGNSEAREIKVRIDGKPLLEHPVIPSNETEIRTVGPKSFIRYNLAIASGNTGPFEVEIGWSDDSGEPGSYRTTLTL